MNVMSDEKLVVLLEAKVSEFEKRMHRAEQRGTRTYQGLRRNSQSATRQMEADMIRSTTAINQAVATTTTKIGALSRAFAGGLLGGAAVALLGGFRRSIRDVLAETGRIADVSDRVKVAIEDLQGLQHGFQLAGFSADEFNAALTRFTRRVGEAVHGGGPLQTTLERYGISVRRTTGEMKTQMEMLREIAETIRRAGTDQEKLAIAQAAFGDVGRRMVNALKGGAGGIDDMIQAARDAGVVMDEELVRKAEEIDRKFSELSASAAAFSKRMIVGLVAAGAELADLRARLDDIFASEAEGRSILGDEIYDALARNRDLVDENTEALARLDERYATLAEEADRAGMALLDAISKLDSLGYDEAADGLRAAYTEMDELVRAIRDGEASGEDFAAKLAQVEKAASDAFGELQAGDRVQFEGVMSQLGRLGGVIASVTSLANSLTSALARAAGVSPDQKAAQAMRDRHAAEQASLDSLNAQREALGNFTAAENARNSATAEQLKLQREIEAVRKRAADAGTVLTDQQAEDFARASLAGDAARGATGKRGGGSKGAKDRKEQLDEFEREVKAIRDRTAALEAEAAVLIALATSGKDYGNALEFARKKAELLHAAQQAGRKITPELEAEIDKLADAYVQAGLAAEGAAQRMELIAERSRVGKDALTDLFGSIFDGSKSAKQAVADLLMEIAKIQMLRGVFGLPGMGGLAAGIGGLRVPGFAAGGQHRGGFRVVGERGPELEATGPARYWSADQTCNLLAGANRSHGSAPAAMSPQKVDVKVNVSVDDDGKIRAYVDRSVAAGVSSGLKYYDSNVVRKRIRQQQDDAYLRGTR